MALLRCIAGITKWTAYVVADAGYLIGNLTVWWLREGRR